MPTELICLGQVTPMVQNTIYALPAVIALIQSSAAVELSMTTTTTDFVLRAASTTGTTTAAPFVRCTTAACTIIAKRA